MATYKVIQDIEAEDKLLGPLTLRQFVYAVIVVVQLFIVFKISTAIGNPLPLIPFLPTIGFFGLLAAPFGQNQSSEIWLLAKIRFMLKPRKRIWDQTGMKELVTITAPKTIDHAYTDGLSQTEVKSRLQALANTIDSRGWAVKNVNVNLSNPAFATIEGPVSDRLIGPSGLPQDVPTVDIYAQDDIMDGTHNATAQALDAKLAESSYAHLQAAKASTQPAAAAQQTTTDPANDYWFMNQLDASAIPAGQAAFAPSPAVMPGSDARSNAADDGAVEQALLQRIHEEKARNKAKHVQGHSKTVEPLGDQREAIDMPVTSKHKAQDEPAQKTVDPKIASLASNNDLNITTIAHEANRAAKPLDDSDGEVVIPLR